MECFNACNFLFTACVFVNSLVLSLLIFCLQAAWEGHANVVEVLIKYDITIDANNEVHNTALALVSCHYELLNITHTLFHQIKFYCFVIC